MYNMYRKKSVFLIVPAYEEETQILKVLTDMPDFVDKVIVVDDGSKDKTGDVVQKFAETDDRVELMVHVKNKGVGAARFTGFRRAIDEGADLLVAIDGDGQMDALEIKHLLDPLVDDVVDFTKANRLASGEAWKIMPRFRFFANAILTLLTKIASGYWHITDTQAGFFAMTRELAENIDYDDLYNRYGCENSLLIHMSVINARAQDVPSKPIYKVGENSRIRVWRDWFPLVRLLNKGFFWRIFQKYVIRDFHPLVFFYMTGLVVSFISALYLFVIVVGRVIIPRMDVTAATRELWLYTIASPLVSALVLIFFVLGAQMLFFAMWMDMQESQHLKEGNRSPFMKNQE